MLLIEPLPLGGPDCVDDWRQRNMLLRLHRGRQPPLCLFVCTFQPWDYLLVESKLQFCFNWATRELQLEVCWHTCVSHSEISMPHKAAFPLQFFKGQEEYFIKYKWDFQVCPLNMKERMNGSFDEISSSETPLWGGWRDAVFCYIHVIVETVFPWYCCDIPLYGSKWKTTSWESKPFSHIYEVSPIVAASITRF